MYEDEDLQEIHEDIVELNEDISDLRRDLNNISASVEGNGENVTLNGTAEARFKKAPLPLGNTEQEQLSGKNLFNKSINPIQIASNYIIQEETETGKRIIYNRDEATSITQYMLYKVLDLTNYVGKTVRCKSNFVSSNNVIKGRYYIGLCDSNGDNREQKAYTATSGEEISFVVPELIGDVKYLVLSLYCNFASEITKNGYTQYNNLTITIDNADMTYEPYCGGISSPSPSYPQPIINVTGDVEVVVKNKNLFDKSNATSKSGYTKDDNGNEISNGGFSYITSYTKVNSNTTYTLSGKLVNNNGTVRIYYYDKNKNWISRSAGFGLNVNVCTFTTPQNCKYIQFQYINVAFDINTIQIEENTVATDCVEHKEQILPLTLGNIELCKIGDYQDYFYKESNKWYLHKEISKRVFNGTEAWYSDGQENKKRKRLDNVLDGIGVVSSNIAKILSNLYRATSADNTYTGNTGIALSITGNTILIYDSNYNTAESTASFKQMLSDNNLILYYALATPTDAQITDTTLISQLEAINNALSYEEQTNISSNQNALFSVKAFRNMNTSIESLQSRIELLKGRS